MLLLPSYTLTEYYRRLIRHGFGSGRRAILVERKKNLVILRKGENVAAAGEKERLKMWTIIACVGE